MQPNTIYKILLNSELSSIIEENKFLNINSFKILELISSALNFDNFCLRNYKPILRELIKEKLVENKHKNFIDDLNISTYNRIDFPYPKYKKHDNTRYKPERYFGNNCTEGFFNIIFKDTSEYRSEVINPILKNYKSQESGNLIFMDFAIELSINELRNFFNTYEKLDTLNFHQMSKEINITWPADILEKYKDRWNWSELQQNPNYNFNFEKIEIDFEILDWYIISGDNNLSWNIENIEYWKDYLIFSTKNESNTVKNKNGRVFYLHPQSNSVSNSKSVKWNKEILEKFKDDFDWSELSKNESINWNIELLDEFSEKIDFKALSTNKNVEWSIELIEKYTEKLNWKNISGNPSLPWSFNFLNKYKDKLFWCEDRGNYKEEYCTISPSISTNTGIVWDAKTLEHFKENLDFWCLSSVAKIDVNSTQIYMEEFNRKEHIGFIFHRYSDTNYTESIYANGWQNLSKNPNFYLDRSLISLYYNNRVPISYANGNPADQGEISTENVRILEILKNKNTNLTQHDLIAYEFEWTKILINDNFMNESIWSDIIKPFLITTGIEVYIKKLKVQLSSI